jgi:mono/diheme cytochrome c family protein
MATRAVWILGAALWCLVGTESWSKDAKAGKELHDARCLKCHGTDLYGASQRKITSLEALQKQVARCAKAAEADWTEAQAADVVEYLNGAFFHLK